MSRFSNFLDKMHNLIAGNAPDQQMEDDARFAGRFPGEPSWYIFLQRKIRLIIFITSFVVILAMFIVTRSREYLSLEGLNAVGYLMIFPIGLIAMPLMAFAAIHRRMNFRKTLGYKQRAVYDTSIKKRTGDFVALFFVTLVVTIIISVIVYYGFLA